MATRRRSKPPATKKKTKKKKAGFGGTAAGTRTQLDQLEKIESDTAQGRGRRSGRKRRR